MKRTSKFLIVLFGVLLATGCSEEKVAEQPNVKLTVDEVVVDMPAEGGKASVKFELDGTVDGAVIKAESKEDWVSSYVFDESSSALSFSVSEWTGEGPRDAKVTVSYAGAADAFVVRQKSAVDYGSIDVTIDEVTDGSVTYTITPQNRLLTYVGMVVEKSHFDSFSTEDEYFNDDMRVFAEDAEKMGVTIEEYLTLALQSGTETIPVQGLKPGVSYYAYAYGLNVKGEKLTEIFKTEFTTETVSLAAYGFEISYEIDGSIVDMTVVPEDNDTFYMFDVAPAGTSDKEIADAMQTYINEYIATYASLGVPPEEAVRNFAKKGKSSYTYNGQLKPETDYLGYAMTITPSGNINSKVVTVPFSTQEVGQSLNRIRLTMTEITEGSAEVAISTTNDDIYIVGYDFTENWAGKKNKEILETLLLGYDWKTEDRRGDGIFGMTGLEPDTEYSVFSFGYKGGFATTDLVRIDFKTPAVQAPEQEFMISLEYDKYFDCIKLAELYPDLVVPFPNCALVPVRVKTTAPYQDLYYHLQEMDMGNTAIFEDDFLIGNLKDDPNSYWNDWAYIRVPYDQSVTFLALAVDLNGNDSPLLRVVDTFTREGASPVSEFVPFEK